MDIGQRTNFYEDCRPTAVCILYAYGGLHFTMAVTFTVMFWLIVALAISMFSVKLWLYECGSVAWKLMQRPDQKIVVTMNIDIFDFDFCFFFIRKIYFQIHIIHLKNIQTNCLPL